MTIEFGNKIISMVTRMCKIMGIHTNFWDECTSVALEQVWKMLKTKEHVNEALIWGRIKYAVLDAARSGSGERLSESTKKMRYAERLDEATHEEFILDHRTPLSILLEDERLQAHAEYLNFIESKLEGNTSKKVFRLLLQGKKSVEASKIIGISEGRVSQCRSKILREVASLRKERHAV